MQATAAQVVQDIDASKKTALRVALVTEGLPFAGDTLEKQSLGGSETAFIYMGRELSKRGHKVTCFCKCSQEGNYDGVDYVDISKYPSIAQFAVWDVVVVSRFAHHLTAPGTAGLRVLWLHDILAGSAPQLSNCLWQTDAIFALSDWHIDDYTKGTTDQGKMPQFRDAFWKTTNGIDMEVVKANIRPKESKKLIYTSRPERGLFFMFRDILPKLLERDPEIKFYYCSYDLGSFPIGDDVKRIIEACDEMAQMFGDRVVKLGSLTKAQLYSEISSSEIWAYSSSFAETNCIGALEAQACGTAVVTSSLAALKETVGNGKSGILIPGQAGEPEYAKRFVEAVCMLLSKPQRLKQLSEYGPKWVKDKGFTWEKIAECWEKKFLSMLTNRWDTKKENILLEMERHSDLVPALQLAKQHGLDSSRLEAAIQSVSPELPKGWTDVQKITQRYDSILNRLAGQKLKISCVLDMECGQAAFGLHLAKRLPDAAVWLVDSNEETRDKLKKSIAKVDGLAERVTVLSPQEAEVHRSFFDLVFSNDQIEMQEDPVAHIKDLSKWLCNDGHLVFTSSFGPTEATISKSNAGKHIRMWNFNFYDFHSMFGNQEHTFAAAVLDEGIGKGGELLGHWLGVCSKTMARNVQTLEIDYRKRIYRPYVSIGTAMIARDAEEWIVKCLKAIRPYVDDIHIALDDRTKDKTMALAYEYGADEVWPAKFDNFSQMRNESTKNLQHHDWIFWVDTDEVMVEGAKLRRYLKSDLFQGFGISQRHLMRDVAGTYDVPIRFYKPTPYHNFSGCVHEHCVDQRKDEFNEQISPSMLISDVDLLHYGYQDENQRRHKCSNRNMELLIRDVKENGMRGRDLSWILVLRDYLNVAKWRLERFKQPIQYKSLEHYLVQAAIRVYLKHFANKQNKYHAMSWDMYQEALALLGMSGVPFEDRPTPPFEIRMALWGNVGGCQNQDVKPGSIWFIDVPQMIAHMSQQTGMLAMRMGVADGNQVGQMVNCQADVKYTWNDNDLDLLTYGTNNIDPVTGRLLRV